MRRIRRQNGRLPALDWRGIECLSILDLGKGQAKEEHPTKIRTYNEIKNSSQAKYRRERRHMLPKVKRNKSALSGLRTFPLKRRPKQGILPYTLKDAPQESRSRRRIIQSYRCSTAPNKAMKKTGLRTGGIKPLRVQDKVGVLAFGPGGLSPSHLSCQRDLTFCAMADEIVRNRKQGLPSPVKHDVSLKEDAGKHALVEGIADRPGGHSTLVVQAATRSGKAHQVKVARERFIKRGTHIYSALCSLLP